MLQQDRSEIRQEISSLSILDLLSLVRQTGMKPNRRHPKKSDLLDHILCHGSHALIESLQDLARKQAADKTVKHLQVINERKRKRVLLQNTQRKALRTDEQSDHRVQDTSTFLELPTDEERTRCYREFYEATNGASLAMTVCGVCA